MKILTTDPEMMDEEEELYRFGSMKSGGETVSQSLMSKVERQAMMHEVKEEARNREQAIMDEMKYSKGREEVMMKEMKEARNMVNEMKKESRGREDAMINDIKASKGREEVMMSLLHDLKENTDKSQSDIKNLHFELAVITLACVGVSLVAFLSLRRTTN